VRILKQLKVNDVPYTIIRVMWVVFLERKDVRCKNTAVQFTDLPSEMVTYGHS